MAPTTKKTRNTTGVVLLSGKGPTDPVEPIAPAPTLASNPPGSKTKGSTSRKNSTEKKKEPLSRKTPSATTSTTTTMTTRNVNMESNDDDMLLEDTPQTTGRSTIPDKTLLAMRQQYKKLQTNGTRIRSHLSFTKQCWRENKVPKGLQVNVKCYAFLQYLSNVQQKFHTTKTTAEESYSKALWEYYVSARTKVNVQLKDLEEAIALKLTQASMEERAEHEYLMAKTRHNVKKQEQRLQDIKQDKIILAIKYIIKFILYLSLLLLG